MKALILAAGYATRLYPLTLTTPKQLLDVGDRPMLEWVLDRLESLDGLDGIYLVTNAKFAPAFSDWAAGYSGSPVTVLDDGTTSDDDRLGAIGDIGFVLDREGIDDDLIVIAGDNLFTGDIDGFVAEGRRRKAPVLAVYDVGDPELMRHYNTTETDADGRITYFEEKPANATSTLAGIALYWYPRAALALIRTYLHEGNNPDQPGRLIEWLYPRTPVYVWRLPGEWHDIGTPSSSTKHARDSPRSRHLDATDAPLASNYLARRPLPSALHRLPTARRASLRGLSGRAALPTRPALLTLRRTHGVAGRALPRVRGQTAGLRVGSRRGRLRRRGAATGGRLEGARAAPARRGGCRDHRRGGAAPGRSAADVRSPRRRPAAAARPSSGGAARGRDRPPLGAACRALPGSGAGSRRQRGLSLAERRRNVGGAFRARVAVPSTVCLVDDVYTSGATVAAAAAALRAAGARRVEVVCFARAVR